MPDWVVWAAWAIAAVAGGVSASESAESGRRQRTAGNIQREAQNLRAAKERREAIRNARIAYAQSEQAAANQGASESSGSKGGLGSIISQMNANVSFLDSQNRASNRSADYMQKAANSQASAGNWAALSKLAFSVGSFQMPGGAPDNAKIPTFR